jgi:hypothetical protein
VRDGHTTYIGEQPAAPVPAPQKPSVGRIVHYQAYGTPGGEYQSAPRAAVVTQVHGDTMDVGLCILNPSGMFFNERIKFSADPKPGHWSWPPRQ